MKTDYTLYIAIKEVDKAVKQAIDMPEMTTTRLSNTGYYFTIRRARTPNGKGSRKIVLVNYTRSNHALKCGSVPQQF